MSTNKQKDVDKVQVEIQGADDGQLVRALVALHAVELAPDLEQLPRVPGRQPQEDHDAEDAGDKLHHRRFHEEVDENGQDRALAIYGR